MQLELARSEDEKDEEVDRRSFVVHVMSVPCVPCVWCVVSVFLMSTLAVACHIAVVCLRFLLLACIALYQTV